MEMKERMTTDLRSLEFDEMQRKKLKIIRQFLMIIVFVGLVTASLFTGVETLNINDLSDKESTAYLIFFSSRIPRTVSLLIAGAGMSISGLIFQHISRNKFVSPTTSGAINGAQLGIVIGLIALPTLSTMGRMIMAFVFALLTSFVFMGLVNRLKFKELIYVPLLGMMMAGVISSVVTFLAYTHNIMQVVHGWFFGSFSLVISGRYEVLYLILPALALCFIYANTFTIAGIGKDFSTNLGLNYNMVLMLGLILVSMVSAAVVIVVGNLPFLGLVVPNLVSLYSGDNMKKSLMEVGIIGMMILLVSDLVCRIAVHPYELPIALVVGILGCLGFVGTLAMKGNR